MSLWICIKNIKDGDRELSIYNSGGLYRIKYRNGNQTTNLNGDITDVGYANYLFDMYTEDLHMEENFIENECEYNIDYFKERIDKHRMSLIKNKGSNNKTRVNRRSSDISYLIGLQTKITDIILKEYGEFEISDSRIDEFIDNQKHMRKVLCEGDYLTTSYGSKLNTYFKSIDTLNSNKLKVCKDKELVRLFDMEIERVELELKEEVRRLLKLK